MTIPEWLTLFTTEAATLPGWACHEGRLRWTSAMGTTACPLRAQANYGRTLTDVPWCQSNGELRLAMAWHGQLTPRRVRQIIDAADTPGARGQAADRLRAALFAACGIREDDEEEETSHDQA